LGFDKGYKLLHAKFEVPKCFNLTLPKADFNRLELFLQKLTDNFLGLPNVLLLLGLFDVLEFELKCILKVANVLTEAVLVKVNNCFLFSNLEAVKYQNIIARELNFLINASFKQPNRALSCFLTLVLTDVSPSALNVWDSASIDRIHVLLGQTHDYLSCEQLSIQSLRLNLAKYFSAEDFHLFLELWPKI
jgi:hypothetical protein